MSARDGGGPAFPINDMQSIHAVAMAASMHLAEGPERERAYLEARGAAVFGMTLRDYFAAHSLGGTIVMCASDMGSGPDKPAYFASRAYEIADAMLKARLA